MDVDDFTFQLKLLMSLRRDSPVDENLRAVMVSTLDRLTRHCGATVAVHVFTNLELSQINILTIGGAPGTAQAICNELMLRHGWVDGVQARSQLPEYRSMRLPITTALQSLLDPLGDVRLEHENEVARQLMVDIRQLSPDEFLRADGVDGQAPLVVPLGTNTYRRLGCILLWGLRGPLERVVHDGARFESVIAYRKSVEQLLIGVFTNFYHMEPHTYLPSFFRVEEKPVAMLCAEIRRFDRIAEILRAPYDSGRSSATDCLRRLVRQFAESSADIVDRYRGRIDQRWGSGVLAIFGEYLDTPDVSPKPACMRAVFAAADLVEAFDEIANRFLNEEFLQLFKNYNSEHVAMAVGAAVDYGYVLFDYVGSQRNRSYMAVGDHINFVKQLASEAGRVEFDPSDTEFLLRQIMAAVRRDRSGNQRASHMTAPILLSQSGYTWSRHVLRGPPDSIAGTVHRPRVMRLPGKSELYSVYELWPENVDRQAS